MILLRRKLSLSFRKLELGGLIKPHLGLVELSRVGLAAKAVNMVLMNISLSRRSHLAAWAQSSKVNLLDIAIA